MSKTPSHDLKYYLNKAVERKASDILLAAGNKPALRISGNIEFISETPLTGEETAKLAAALASEQTLSRISAEGIVDVTATLENGGIARVGISRSCGHYSIGVRFLGDYIPSLKECGLPEVAQQFLDCPNGIVIVSGPTGSGKTTTLLGMLDWINENKAAHICTVGMGGLYPIKPKRSVVQQREVGSDVSSMVAGITAGLHQDMDVILVGEIDSFETLAACLNAAETGHLVLIQIHSQSASDAIKRVMDAIPERMQQAFWRRFAEVLRGVTFQVLARNAGRPGRSAIYEVLNIDALSREDIRNGKDTIRSGTNSIALRDELARLEKEGRIVPEDAATIRAAFLK